MNSNKKYGKEEKKTEVNYRFIKITRCRINHAFNGKFKSFFTKDIFGLDIDTFKKWIDIQMTRDLNWKKINIDRIRPVSPNLIQPRMNS